MTNIPTTALLAARSTLESQRNKTGCLVQAQALRYLRITQELDRRAAAKDPVLV